ncbi:MAG TPA: serine--tRNA ligase [Candidatus Latescibacteria bacterium]|nr:serine--tRNA ligase [Candidatus Latescibacterota bacterium]
MLEIRFIRENPELVRRAIRNKGEDVDLDRLLELDLRRRELIREGDELKRRRNEVSKEIGRLKKAGGDPSGLIEEMGGVARRVKEIDQELREVQDELEELLLRVPNVPDPDVPVGEGEEDNVEVRRWGEVPEPDFRPLPHWELGDRLGILDLGRGSKLAGSGFQLFKGAGALLQRALISFMLDLHTKKHGYQEVWPPALATRPCMTGTGQLPKLEEDMYICEKDDLFLIPTAEVPLTNLHREEILPGDVLPLYYTAYTPCFRREAGSYGRETRGIVRVHQFDKVELVKFVKPEDSEEELEKLVREAEEVLQLLGLPYRVMLLCTGDLSFAAAKCYDIEVWAMGMGRYLEVSSCSNFRDFQARRAGIRFRRSPDSKAEYVHTLNGSGLALPRTVAAIMENYQTPEGSIIVPEVLRPYMDGMEVIS